MVLQTKQFGILVGADGGVNRERADAGAGATGVVVVDVVVDAVGAAAVVSRVGGGGVSVVNRRR